ncbi:retroviral-like aspartic protease family protein [Candidatus Sumerlaeota bacterium]|nr:retroviral-like aspartic protease family protein [Candidatus Sumerlaeota bacterium]
MIKRRAKRAIVSTGLAILIAFFAVHGRADEDRALIEAWSAWRSGDITFARELARDRVANEEQSDEANHLLFLTAFVAGDYEGALAHYGAIGKSYASLKELDEPVQDAYLHLGRIPDALEFVRSREDSPDWMVQILERRVAQPFRVSLSGVSVVPFADHPLTDYFPGFDVEINGTPVTAHVDTGGTYLHMGPHRATQLGIELTEGGEGFHGATKVKLFHGMAQSFRLGDAILDNVPVIVLPSLVGSQDFIIFGTSVLQQFLSTLDYPNKRLILSPLDSPGLRDRHLGMLPQNRTEMPFYMWGDHYMFARGSLGDHSGLNFFVDSGLVLLSPDGKGGMRQASFTTSKEKLAAWGFTPEQVDNRTFESDQSLALGSIVQTEPLLAPGRVGDTSFGGVRIDGLISHGFLKANAWTLDFPNRRYIFSSEPE